MLEVFSQIAGVEQLSGQCVLFMRHVATQQTTDFLIIVEQDYNMYCFEKSWPTCLHFSLATLRTFSLCYENSKFDVFLRYVANLVSHYDCNTEISQTHGVKSSMVLMSAEKKMELALKSI